MRGLLGALSLAAMATTAPAATALLAEDPTRSSGVAAAATTGVERDYKHVVVISIDGLNPQALRQLGEKRVPTLSYLMREGASTLNARTEVESTSTLPNHTGMMTGRRVDAATGGHGVTFNDDEDGTTVHAAAGSYIHSIFDVVHNRGLSTALYTSKDKFAFYNRSYDAAHGAPDRTGADDGRDKIDTFVYFEDEGKLTQSASAKLKTAPAALTFVHYSITDKVGHEKGFMSPAYLDAVAGVDARIKVLRRAARSVEAQAKDFVFIVTSDHGGDAEGHREPGKRAYYTVPFIVWGPSVARGVDLYDLNPQLADPGSSRPGYAAKKQPVRNGMVANLAMDFLALPSVPGSEFNSKQGLTVFTTQAD